MPENHPILNVLFLSDLHLPLGPREPIRPEMRRLWCKLGVCGEKFMDRFEDWLRDEANHVHRLASLWMDRHARGYDLVINGGDNAMPLSRHEDRIETTREVWMDHLDRFGEEHYIALTGNHELGHGYLSEASCYPDLQRLRRELFSSEINVKGFGAIHRDATTLLFIDSELISVAQIAPFDPLIRSNLLDMARTIESALPAEGPLAVITHNTERTRKWLRRAGFWADLLRSGRRVYFIGGHYHVPRTHYRDGVEIHWSGGASYPEPWLRYLIRVPFTGVQRGGPGVVELMISGDRLRIRHRHFGVHLGLLKWRHAA